MRTVPLRRSAGQNLSQRLLHPPLVECFGFAGAFSSATGNASSAWFAANKPLAMPFTVATPVVVKELGWFNGTSAGGNVDMGIYDTSWNRLVSTGSTAGSGASTFQFVDVTDTALSVGRYYVAMVRDNTTANRAFQFSHTLDIMLMEFFGCYDSATDAIPLPNPLTNMVPAATATRIPLLYIEVRQLG